LCSVHFSYCNCELYIGQINVKLYVCCFIADVCVFTENSSKRQRKMNVYYMSCRNVRSLGVMLAVVVCVYIALNIAYINFFSDSVSTDNENTNLQSLAAHLKLGKPDANGKVEVVVSLDVEQLAKLLGNSDLSGLYNERDDKKTSVEVAERRVVINNGSAPRPVNVSYILYNPALCDGLPSGLTWVVGIGTTPDQSDRRKLLRETWANVSLFRQNVFRTFFVMGRASDAQQGGIQAEFDQYRDIVEGDFVDVSHNATLKGLLALHYITQYCSAAKYFIKANDDTFLNIFSMMQLFEASAVHQHSVVCPLWKENTMPILRDPKECMQWCVRPDELPGRTHFPQYCAGLGFALSREIVSALYSASLSMPYFWIDDVHITGLLMSEVSRNLHGIHYVDLISNFTLVEGDIENEYGDSRKSIHYIIAKIRNADIYRKVWKALLNRLTPAQFKLLSNTAIMQK